MEYSTIMSKTFLIDTTKSDLVRIIGYKKFEFSLKPYDVF